MLINKSIAKTFDSSAWWWRKGELPAHIYYYYIGMGAEFLQANETVETHILHVGG